MTKVFLHFKGKGNFFKVITNVSKVWIRDEILYVSHISNGVEVQMVYPVEYFDFDIY